MFKYCLECKIYSHSLSFRSFLQFQNGARMKIVLHLTDISEVLFAKQFFQHISVTAKIEYCTLVRKKYVSKYKTRNPEQILPFFDQCAVFEKVIFLKVEI